MMTIAPFVKPIDQLAKQCGLKVSKVSFYALINDDGCVVSICEFEDGVRKKLEKIIKLLEESEHEYDNKVNE